MRARPRPSPPPPRRVYSVAPHVRGTASAERAALCRPARGHGRQVPSSIIYPSSVYARARGIPRRPAPCPHDNTVTTTALSVPALRSPDSVDDAVDENPLVSVYRPCRRSPERPDDGDEASTIEMSSKSLLRGADISTKNVHHACDTGRKAIRPSVGFFHVFQSRRKRVIETFVCYVSVGTRRSVNPVSLSRTTLSLSHACSY